MIHTAFIFITTVIIVSVLLLALLIELKQSKQSK